MNFYESQDQARKQTGRLVLLFMLALAALILLTAFVIAAVAYILGMHNARFESYETGQSVWQIATVVFEWQYLGSIALAVLAVVALASLFRMSQLKSGGRVIAEQLGGRLININPRDASEKKLLNVVEEMAIASGTPVPSVYLMDEPGINAFAAGYQPADAVIGVTRGAIEQLSRQELQGVIAHEFSHILNGDMRLNLRLIGIVYGIVIIALSGRYLLHGTRHSSKDRGAVLGIGLALILLGYLGVFFGNLIKAAISRQREFLADASAVQFTRSQDGISGALKKIGGLSYHSVWQKHDVNEISHMLFAQGLHFSFFNRWMATHPPLDRRIKRIDPRWNGDFTVPSSVSNVASASSPVNQSSSEMVSSLAADDLMEAVDHSGQLNDETITSAVKELSLLQIKFETLCSQIHDPYNARSLVYAMLLDRRSSIQQLQWQSLQQYCDNILLKQTQSIDEQLQQLESRQPMLLLDMALPILKLLSDDQYRQFKQQMLRLIKIDKKVELREWALFYLVEYYCRPTQLNRLHMVSLKQRKPAMAKLLSALASIGASSEKEAEAIFLNVTRSSLGFSLRWYPIKELTIPSLTQSLQHVRDLKPLEKPRFLKACIGIVQHDGVVDSREVEIISCIAQALDCPLPYMDVR